jgi:pimeloyl-ACP methyl ester carboxylesterase
MVSVVIGRGVPSEPALSSTSAIFIHGAWLTPASWEFFRSRYTACGYTCITPAWPFQDLTVDELRHALPSELAGLTIGRIVDHYAAIVQGMPEPPLLVGHSFGGLFVQMLLDRGVGRAGVAIVPVPARGVWPGLATLRTALRVPSAWGGRNRILTMTPARFARDFAQSLAADELQEAYDRYIVPTPGRIYYQAALGIGSRVDYANDRRAPLLLIAGEQDRSIRASVVRATYRRHLRSVAETSFKQFSGRTHWLILEPGWEEVADYTIQWAAGH